MKRLPFLATVVTLALVLAGCAQVSRLVTARVEIAAGTNKVSVVQPKDTTIDRLVFDPGRGALTLEGYASAGNAEAIAAARAQAEAQARVMGQALGMVELLSAAVLRTQGVPIDPAALSARRGVVSPPATNPPTSNVFVVPAGMKLVPKDDPSTPKPEIE